MQTPTAGAVEYGTILPVSLYRGLKIALLSEL